MQEKQRLPNKPISPKTPADKTTGLDLSFQGLRSLSPSLFLLHTIKELQLNNNELEFIPKDIYKMKSLERLNFSYNKIRCIPPEIGRMVQLKELFFNDNLISTVPMELGSLYNLEVLNLNNNPLIAPFNTLSKDKVLIHFCRENNTGYSPPADRAWMDTVLRRDTRQETISVATYNILCNFFASKLTYAPSWVINQDVRKEAILQNIISYNVDILSLQEIETYSYCDFYKDQLEIRLDYDSVFYPKGRSLTLADKRTVDGCATFWKKKKFRLVEQVNIDFYQKIISDIRFSLNQDILMRHARKDNVALVTILEGKDNSLLIVVNVHLYWDPEYTDVKLFQTILLLEEIEKIKARYNNPLIISLGDFNSLKGSSVYDLIIDRKITGGDFNLYDYSPMNAGFKHTTRFSDAYLGQDLTFTNFTPTFKGTIDYIFFSEGLNLTGVLSPVEDDYTENTVGFPNIHFPSDHILIGARFSFKSMSNSETIK